MKPLTLRAQVVAWFVGLTIVLLVVASLVMYWNTRDNLHADLDRRMASTATGLVALSDWDEHADGVEFELDDDLADRMAASRPGSSEEIFHWPDQILVHRRGRAVLAPMPDPDWGAQHDLTESEWIEFADGEDSDGRYRICSILAYTPPDPEELDAHEFTLLIRVQESLAPLEAELAAVLRFMGLFGLAAIGLAIVLGFALARRVTGPLQSLGVAAGQVRAGRPARLPHRGVDDEVDQLRDHLDDAFQRLDAALHRQARFTSDAAHELRNPIAVIQNAAEVALRRERTVDDYRHFFADVLATATRMGRVVDALLLLARLDAVRTAASFQAVDLSEIARDSASSVAEGSERIQVDCEEEASVRGDDGLLRVLVDNLVSNALRYSPVDRPIQLRVHLEADQGVILEVSDEGPGIPNSARERIFDRFFRASADESTGAGLGLAIVSEVASVHAVQAQVETSAEGTTFRVRFPKVDQAA